MSRLSDIRVRRIVPVFSPSKLLNKLPISATTASLVLRSRKEIGEIVRGEDFRLLIIVGPCSIHDPEKGGLEYAKRLAELARQIKDRILVVMRTYFEKPRTTNGWKGLIYDPDMDGSGDVGKGLTKAREFLLEVNNLGLPAAVEFLDTITPQYLTDAVSCGAIGARSVEDQVHRQMASGLSCPIGFKNGTSGSVKVAIDAMRVASLPHTFPGIDRRGRVAMVETVGNSDTFLILRGSENAPNYHERSVQEAVTLLENRGLNSRLVVDCSHGNSGKDYRKQGEIFRNMLTQRTAGNQHIAGMMLESYLFPGNQKLDREPGRLQYGVSVTDSCIGWEETELLLETAYYSLVPD